MGSTSKTNSLRHCPPRTDRPPRGISPHPATPGTISAVTTHPDLAVLGRPELLDGVDPAFDTLPQLLLAAVHEAGHAVARMHYGVPGGDLHIQESGVGRSHGLGGQVDVRDLVYVAAAGPLAEGELAARVHDEGDFVRDVPWLWGYANGDVDDLLRAPDWAFNDRVEAETLATLRHNWPAVLRLAAALLAAPTYRLTWDEQVAVIGTLEDAPDEVFVAVDTELTDGMPSFARLVAAERAARA